MVPASGWKLPALRCLNIFFFLILIFAPLTASYKTHSAGLTPKTGLTVSHFKKPILQRLDKHGDTLAVQLNLPDLIVPVTSLQTACMPPETSLSVYGSLGYELEGSGTSKCLLNFPASAITAFCSQSSLVFVFLQKWSKSHTPKPLNPNPTGSGWITESRKNRQSTCNRPSLLSYYCSSSHNPARALFLECSTGLLSDGISLLNLHSSLHTCTEQPQFMLGCVLLSNKLVQHWSTPGC